MIKIKKVVETKEVDIVEDIICNKCGESCGEEQYGYEGLIGAAITGGYASKYIGDSCQFRFDVCEKCLVEFIQTFKIPAEFEDLVNLPIHFSKDFYEKLTEED